MIPHPDPTASQAAHDAYDVSFNAHNEVACLMLGSMSPKLQKALENYRAYDMIKELKTMFKEQAKQELYLDTLERLGYAMPNELGVSLILNSLNNDYDQFIQVYNMHSMGKMLAKLHVMLKLLEKGILKKAETLVVLAIREGKIQKDKKKKSQGEKGKAKGKNKLAYAPKTKILPPPKRDNPTKDSICHHCKEVVTGGGIRDGILQPTHNESHIKCKSCIYGKMARKPFPHQVERAKDLLTPPYTSQHNGVSERRNRTLLDMVRSMMNLTTLPKFFWGYALETAAHIFNMVPTKKDYTSALTPDEPVLSTEEPDNSLSMGDEHLDTILATKSDEFIKFSVENLISIPSESEGIPDHRCDVPFLENSPPRDVSKDQTQDFSESNEEFSLIDDDSFSIDNIDYVEAS
nr:zinc finger, CCHC-type [Tanacetum cinerariifolium]